MEVLKINGGNNLSGSVKVDGAKNAALPILAATTIVGGTHRISNVPDLRDIDVMLQILESLGCETSRNGDIITVDSTAIHSTQIPEHLMRRMRSSIFLMGPLIARFGEVETFQPGGCAIGERKMDIHFSGLEELGVKFEQNNNSIRGFAGKLKGTTVSLRFPSVGATENLMMAAVKTDGLTVIENVAREPEIVDLQDFLNGLGAKVSGAGSSSIRVEGVGSLSPSEHRVMPDRIVAGTILCATVACGGTVDVIDARIDHVDSLVTVLREIGADIEQLTNGIRVTMHGRPNSIGELRTGPYPEFPTDLQSQLMVILSISSGTSVIRETIFESRFQHVDQLNLMGAEIQVEGELARIRGVENLLGTRVSSTDLRAGAALVIAGMVAKGETTVGNLNHIDRGYHKIESLFSGLGASIKRES
jgi:UDP-N-acetylglucosamine 1-carboxyvinyltransferase